MQTAVVLCLGGNKGDRERILQKAVDALEDGVGNVQLSEIYETAAWGGVAQGPFLNQIAVILTEKLPEEVLEMIQTIEADLGRTRDEHWGNRTMDIDILYFGDRVIDTDQLKIPHPFLSERKFVLVPLAAILPQKMHPVTGKNSVEMLADCQDLSAVKVFRSSI